MSDPTKDRLFPLIQSVVKSDDDRSTVEAMSDFMVAVRRSFPEQVLALGLGRFDGRPSICVIIPEIDMKTSLAIYHVQGSIEDAHGTSFDVHVTPAQGRPAKDLAPAGFQLVA